MTVLVFGTFDIFHPGHAYFLREAKKHGKKLIVVVARDRTVAAVKGRPPKHDEKTRQAAVKKSRLAGQVILGRLGDKYALIKKYRPNVICLGYDQKFFTEKLEEKLKQFRLETKIVRLKPFRPHVYKSSKLTTHKSSKIFSSIPSSVGQ